MKHTVLSLAVTAAIGAMGSAHAFDPEDPATPADYDFAIAGATAPTMTIREVIISNLCEPAAGPIDVYISGGSTKHYNVACQARGERVLFRKNDGGSGAGTTPVDDVTTANRTFLNVGKADCAAGVGKSANGVNYTEYASCGTGTAATLIDLQPDFGASDIEPTAFKGQLQPAEGPFKNVSNMEITSVAGLAFGFNVTLKMYRALQSVQFPSGSDCNPVPNGGDDLTKPDPANPHLRIAGANNIKDAYEAPATDSGVPVAAGSSSRRHTLGDTEQCLPNLAREEVRSLLARDITTANQLWVGPNAADTLFAKAPAQFKPVSANLFMCRRTSGSGTHAVTAIHFLGTECGVGGRVMPAGCNGPALCGTVVQNEASSGVRDCLANAETANVWGYGYNSLESNASLDIAYRFVKIDHVAPTLGNLLAGDLFHFGEVTLQRRGNAAGTADLVNVPNGFETDAIALWNTLKTEMQTPANAAVLNGSAIFKHAFGQSGWAARGTTGIFPPNLNAPVNPLTHVKPAALGGQQDTCFGPYTPNGSAIKP